LPWWAAPDLRIHFLRPLTGLAFAADDRLFGDDPLGYHVVSLAWYAALLLAAAALFRRLLPAAASDMMKDKTTAEGAFDLPYALPNRRVEHVLTHEPIPVGYS